MCNCRMILCLTACGNVSVGGVRPETGESLLIAPTREDSCTRLFLALEVRRTGHTPLPADFDHDFPALIARTLSDLTPDERRVLRSVSLLDAFDVALAARTAGLAHEGPAARLSERPFAYLDPAPGCGHTICTP